jgi:soluble lytic murein transglycosylase-like protein
MSLAMLMTLGATESAVEASDRATALAATITAAADWAGVTPELLAAVTWVESLGNPLALGIGGQALSPRNHAEAVALLQAVGGRADIGLAQIHYPIWGPVFGLRPEDLLDPWTNLHVAAAILRHAMDQEPGSWGGVGRYHSATPWRKWWYARRVATVANALRVPAPLPNHAPGS